jgi:hypothetical protein
MWDRGTARSSTARSSKDDGCPPRRAGGRKTIAQAIRGVDSSTRIRHWRVEGLAKFEGVLGASWLMAAAGDADEARPEAEEGGCSWGMSAATLGASAPHTLERCEALRKQIMAGEEEEEDPFFLLKTGSWTALSACRRS